MAANFFSLVPQERIVDLFGNLQAFTGLVIQLDDSGGMLLISFGQSASCCTILKKRIVGVSPGKYRK